MEKKIFEFVVVGGGMAGVCAAIAASRKGIKTALVQNRPVLGGNASSEIRMHICGADHHMSRKNARETGILEEILLENKRRNPEMNYAVFDAILWEKVRFQKNLTLFLNTYMDGVLMAGNKIQGVTAVQETTEKKFELTADLFLDATGDGTLGYLAGAEYRSGREAKNEYGESLAPDQSDHVTMGNSLMFQAKDTGHPVRFIKPDWAYDFTEEQLKNRDHRLITSGYWWIELGGGEQDTIADAEELRDELMKTVYGIWDHIKNGGDHGAENYDLTWVGMIPGKRESRRLIGDYVLKQQDIEEGKIFEDAVAYGGWPMDIHTTEGFLNTGEQPTVWNPVSKIYTIPYRCLYSVNIENLFLGGRVISCSHVAFSSTRVMGTCAVAGQAAGTAAAMAIRRRISPREVGRYIMELQQELLRDDCYIPGFVNQDEIDMARTADISASSWETGFEPVQVADGYGRMEGGESHCWQTDLLTDQIPELILDFGKRRKIQEVRIKFDSNLSREITPSVNDEVLERQERQSPSELVRDYELIFEDTNGKKEILSCHSKGQRFQVIQLEQAMSCSRMRLRILNTYGRNKVRVFEVRVYETLFLYLYSNMPHCRLKDASKKNG